MGRCTFEAIYARVYVCLHACLQPACMLGHVQTDRHTSTHARMDISNAHTHRDTERERESKKAQVDANMHSTHYIALPLLLLTVHCLALLGAWPARLIRLQVLSHSRSVSARPASLSGTLARKGCLCSFWGPGRLSAQRRKPRRRRTFDLRQAELLVVMGIYVTVTLIPCVSQARPHSCSVLSPIIVVTTETRE